MSGSTGRDIIMHPIQPEAVSSWQGALLGGSVDLLSSLRPAGGHQQLLSSPSAALG
jgi:hypothetical protein